MKMRIIISPQDFKSQNTVVNGSWGENLWFDFLWISIRTFGHGHDVKLGTDHHYILSHESHCSDSETLLVLLCLCWTQKTLPSSLASLYALLSYPYRSYCSLFLSLTVTYCICPPTATAALQPPRASSPIPSSPAELSLLLYSACTHCLFSVVLFLWAHPQAAMLRLTPVLWKKTSIILELKAILLNFISRRKWPELHIVLLFPFSWLFPVRNTCCIWIIPVLYSVCLFL